MPVPEPRAYAAALLLVALALILLLFRFLAARSSRPAILYTACGYWVLLHFVFLYGLLFSTRFEDGLALLTLIAFPLSAIVSDTHSMPGFATLSDLVANYISFGLCGAANTLLIVGFLSLVLPRRAPGEQSPSVPR